MSLENWQEPGHAKRTRVPTSEPVPPVPTRWKFLQGPRYERQAWAGVATVEMGGMDGLRKYTEGGAASTELNLIQGEGGCGQRY